MRRVIALMLSIAMVASLATGLAVTGFAANVGETFITGGINYEITSIDPNEVKVILKSYSGSITIPDNVTYGSDTYTVTAIGESAFFEEYVTSVTIPDSVKTIGKQAFYGCTDLTSVTVGNGVTSIGEQVFEGCEELTSVIIGNGVTSIGSHAFEDCTGLTSVKIPNSVTSIGLKAFYGCTGLTSVTIGTGITSIGQEAFSGCSNLTSFTIKAVKAPYLNYDAFSGCSKLTTIYVPEGSLYEYEEGENKWSYYSGNFAKISGSGITINDEPIETCIVNYGGSIITSDANSVTVNKISKNENITIDIPSGRKLIVNNTSNGAGNPGPDGTCAIYSQNGNITITGGGTLEATAVANNAIQSDYSGSITINGVTVIATGNGSNMNGIYAGGDLNITDATVIATGNGESGIYSGNGSITISGENTVVEATCIGNNSYGIYSGNGNVKITGGIVKATGKSGIYSNKFVTITDGTITVTGTNEGIYAGTGMNISGGIVNAAGDYGLYTGGSADIKISGGIVNAVSLYSYNGIYSAGNVEISGGQVTADGKTSGIEAKQIKLSGGYVRAKGSATMPTYEAGQGIYVGEIKIDDETKAQSNFYCEDDTTHTIVIFGQGIQCNTPSTHFICYGVPTTGITINEKELAECYRSYGADTLTVSGDTVTVDKITTNTDTNIYIPSGKTLIVSTTNDNAIFTYGKITVTGGGKLVAYCGANKSAIYADGGLEIYGVTVKATLKGGSFGFGAKDGGVVISNSDLTVNSAGQYGIVALESGDVTIYNSNVTATGSGICNYVICAKNGNITITGGTVEAISNGMGGGIHANNVLNISSNNVKAKAQTAFSSGNGIFVKGVTITDQNYSNYFEGENVTSTDGKVIKGSGFVKCVLPTPIDTGIFINNTTITNFNYKSLGITLINNNFDYNSTTNTLTIAKIDTNTDTNIYIPSGNTLIVSNTDENPAILVENADLTITGSGKLIAKSAIIGIVASGNDNGNLTINDCEVIAEGTAGMQADGILSISSNKVNAKGQYAFMDKKGINVNGNPITDANVGDYFNNADGYGQIEDYYAISPTNINDFVTVKSSTPPPPPGPRDPLPAEEEEQADPEIDIDLGFGTVRVKSSEKSLVMDEKRLIDKIAEELDGDKISFDLTKAYIADTKSTKDFDGVYFNNDIYKELGVIDKDIEINTRYAKAIVYTGKEVGNNPLSLHLSDVSKEQGKCATAIQKDAMQTSKIYAEVNYSFVTNGKPTENDAKIYVPVDGPAKVFYLFNAEKIGIVPCEVIDGYCVFDRYFDGSYVICSAD